MNVLARWQWMLLALLVIGVGVYRGFLGDAEPSPDVLTARSAEIEHVWNRITPYPGTKMSGAQSDRQVTETAVVSIRRWTVEGDWDAVRTHFEQSLRDAAWYKVGEAKTESDTPLLLFRQDPYHMTVTMQGNVVELRASWSADGSPILP